MNIPGILMKLSLSGTAWADWLHAALLIMAAKKKILGLESFAISSASDHPISALPLKKQLICWASFSGASIQLGRRFRLR